jgi:hypothetical protein
MERSNGSIGCDADVPPPFVRRLCAPLEENQSVLDHSSPWLATQRTDGLRRCRDRFDDRVVEALCHAIDALENRVGEDISRREVFSMADGEPLEFFVAIERTAFEDRRNALMFTYTRCARVSRSVVRLGRGSSPTKTTWFGS